VFYGYSKHNNKQKIKIKNNKMKRLALYERAESDPALSSHEVGVFEDFCRMNGREPEKSISKRDYSNLRKKFDERKKKFQS